MAKINLKALEQRAIKATVEPDKIVIPKPNQRRMKKVLETRLIASEYLRNGLNMKAAFESVTRRKYTTARFNAMLAKDNSFMEEIDLALGSADIEKNKVLTMLWAMATVSVLDFVDDNGVTLPVSELKKLPREMQALIEQVDVTNEQQPIKDANGNIMTDDNGRPYLQNVQKVRVRIVSSKKDALNIIAQIGKMVGPSTLIQNNYVTNIGQNMVDADQRRVRLLAERHGNVIEGTSTEVDGGETGRK